MSDKPGGYAGQAVLELVGRDSRTSQISPQRTWPPRQRFRIGDFHKTPDGRVLIPTGIEQKTGLLREKSPLTQEKRRNFEHSLPGPVYIIG
jgi:hypothetical protein